MSEPAKEAQPQRISADQAIDFVAAVLAKQGVPEGAAREVAADLVASDLLNRDQRRIDGGRRFHKHPALHFRRQQPLEALEFTHGKRDHVKAHVSHLPPFARWGAHSCGTGPVRG